MGFETRAVPRYAAPLAARCRAARPDYRRGKIWQRRNCGNARAEHNRAAFMMPRQSAAISLSVMGRIGAQNGCNRPRPIQCTGLVAIGSERRLAEIAVVGIAEAIAG
jgi:hypothetical protein